LKNQSISGGNVLKIDYITIKGVRELNEDSIIINKDIQVYGVADGVSSLVPFKDRENLTGGYIASNEVKRYFDSLKVNPSILYNLEIINERIQKKMRDNHIDILKKEQLWGTALAVIKVSENRVEFAQTGDCMILAVYQDNYEVRPLTRVQVAHLENLALTKWKGCIKEGLIKRDDLIKQVEDILISNRQKSNTTNGYGVLNGEAEAFRYIEYGKINRNRLKHLILITDGMFLPTEIVPNNINYWDYITNSILEKGIEQYALDLVRLEELDPECLKYPRFKKSDDKAGIVINF
jgi:serine/threonine protein phosphatase PrpC